MQKAAAKMGKEPLDFCTENANQFKHLFELSDVEYDTFIRTSDPVHHRAVQKTWNILKQRGLITVGTHSGFYSVNEETFVPKKDLIYDEAENVYRTELGEVV
jgi:methionyl-tRNA synthetase